MKCVWKPTDRLFLRRKILSRKDGFPVDSCLKEGAHPNSVLLGYINSSVESDCVCVNIQFIIKITLNLDDIVSCFNKYMHSNCKQQHSSFMEPLTLNPENRTRARVLSFLLYSKPRTITHNFCVTYFLTVLSVTLKYIITQTATLVFCLYFSSLC